MKQKLDIYEKSHDDEEDKKESLLRDLQIDYDKYLKLYQKDLEIKSSHKDS